MPFGSFNIFEQSKPILVVIIKPYLTRFMDARQYEVRHKSLVKDIWDIDNTCKIMPHEQWSLWYPNDNCDKASVKPNYWPDCFINIENKFDGKILKSLTRKVVYIQKYLN